MDSPPGLEPPEDKRAVSVEEARRLAVENAALAEKNAALKEQMALAQQNAQLAQENARLTEQNAAVQRASMMGMGFMPSMGGFPNPMLPPMGAYPPMMPPYGHARSSGAWDPYGVMDPYRAYGGYSPQGGKHKKNSMHMTGTKSTPSGRGSIDKGKERGSAVKKTSSSKSNKTEDGASDDDENESAKAARIRLRELLLQKKEHNGPQTTAMMRNIPPEYTRTTLLELVDKSGFAACYDLVYLPIEFKSQANLGYAFLNFVKTEDAERFKATFQGFKDWFCTSEKVCEVSWSDVIQGTNDHVERYRNSPVMHESVPDEFKPALFKDGARIEFPPPTKKIRPPKQKKDSVVETKAEGEEEKAEVKEGDPAA